MPKLSVAIITYNEEHRIADCLASVASIADEIIVLDSYSTDQTETICRNTPNVQFFQHAFDGHIEQKNRALEYCTGDWILSLDADERASVELQQSIQAFLQSPPEDIQGAKIPRLTFHMQRYIKHSGWYPSARYRLIRKGKAHWGGENPHDTLILDGKGTRLSGDILHFSFKDLAAQVHTVNHFSSIVALTRYNHHKKPSLFRLLVKPWTKFLEIYFIKRGFLDRLPGFVIAITSAYSTFLKEAKLIELARLDADVPSNLSDQYHKNH